MDKLPNNGFARKLSLTSSDPIKNLANVLKTGVKKVGPHSEETANQAAKKFASTRKTSWLKSKKIENPIRPIQERLKRIKHFGIKHIENKELEKTKRFAKEKKEHADKTDSETSQHTWVRAKPSSVITHTFIDNKPSLDAKQKEKFKKILNTYSSKIGNYEKEVDTYQKEKDIHLRSAANLLLDALDQDVINKDTYRLFYQEWIKNGKEGNWSLNDYMKVNEMVKGLELFNTSPQTIFVKTINEGTKIEGKNIELKDELAKIKDHLLKMEEKYTDNETHFLLRQWVKDAKDFLGTINNIDNKKIGFAGDFLNIVKEYESKYDASLLFFNHPPSGDSEIKKLQEKPINDFLSDDKLTQEMKGFLSTKMAEFRMNEGNETTVHGFSQFLDFLNKSLE